MKAKPHLEDSPGLSPEELEVIMRTARRQSDIMGTASSDEGVNWRLLGYIVLTGAIVVLLALQLAG